MATKALRRWTTDELETAVYSNSLDNIQRYEAERILSERERAPERRFIRRTYNAAAWALAFSMGTFIVTLIILWLFATGKSLP
jgi:cytochrome c-type biogenesis protein CcmH/NrfG